MQMTAVSSKSENNSNKFIDTKKQQAKDNYPSSQETPTLDKENSEVADDALPTSSSSSNPKKTDNDDDHNDDDDHDHDDDDNDKPSFVGYIERKKYKIY